MTPRISLSKNEGHFVCKSCCFVFFSLSTPCPSFPNACSPLIPGLVVVVSYGVAISYVTADAVAKGYKCAKESDSK